MAVSIVLSIGLLVFIGSQRFLIIEQKKVNKAVSLLINLLILIEKKWGGNFQSKYELHVLIQTANG